MAKKKNEIKYAELTTDELQVRLREGRDRLFQLRFQNSTAPLKDTREIRRTRRDIARALTFLRQKGVSA